MEAWAVRSWCRRNSDRRSPSPPSAGRYLAAAARAALPLPPPLDGGMFLVREVGEGFAWKGGRGRGAYCGGAGCTAAGWGGRGDTAGKPLKTVGTFLRIRPRGIRNHGFTEQASLAAAPRTWAFLLPSKIQKFFKILRHIEFLYACMVY